MINYIQDTNDSFAIRIKNSGGYMAQFYLTYQVDFKKHKLDSGAFSLGYSKTLNIPQNAKMIYLELQIWIFGGMRNLVEDYITAENHCFNLTGTIFDAAITELPCNLLGAETPDPPIKKCCCKCCCCRRR